MLKKWIVITSILLCGFALNAAADIYRSVDSDGSVTFSDQPSSKSETVSLPESNISKQPAEPTIKSATTDAQTKKSGYTVFEIESPKDQDTIQNATEIVVSIKIKPNLQKGDTIQVLLDGQAVTPASTSTTAVIPKTRGDDTIITRGSHTISAVLYNENNKKIDETATVTVFVHYANVLFPASATPNPPVTQAIGPNIQVMQQRQRGNMSCQTYSN